MTTKQMLQKALDLRLEAQLNGHAAASALGFGLAETSRQLTAKAAAQLDEALDLELQALAEKPAPRGRYPWFESSEEAELLELRNFDAALNRSCSYLA